MLHKCDNPSCINPNHLFLGTAKDNFDDCRNKGRTATGDKNGMRLHPEKVNRGSKHPSSKLNEKQVLEIRKLKNQFSHLELSKIFNISKSVVKHIIHRRSWKHI